MKIQIQCRQCFEAGLLADKEKKVPYIPTYSYWNYPVVQIDKWPYFEMECPNGHKHRYIMSNELYEVLFQQATYCLQDGYYREAIGTYHAALERLFEYAIEILCYHANRSEEYNEIWKKISKQSERQLGAFYSLWYSIVGELPEFLDEKRVKFRNQVVHQGKLATKEEAKEYGAYVFNYIRRTYKKLKEEFGETFEHYCSARLIRVCHKDLQDILNNAVYDENGDSVGSVFIPNFISDTSRFPDYDSCFTAPVNNVCGFSK